MLYPTANPGQAGQGPPGRGAYVLNRMGLNTIRGWSLALASGLGALAIVASACTSKAEEPAVPAHRGPIVLITIDALRADVLGALGGPPKLTPALDSLAREAAWAGRAVSPSSWTVPSMASLFTGLQPWSNQSWHGDRAVLAEELVTLPEALKAEGFRTSAFRSNHWLQQQYGYAQGFDTFRYLKEGKRAEEHLAKLQGGQDFVWIHILPPHAPYVRREHLLAQLPEAPENLPRRVRPLDLEPYYDPEVPLPEEEEKVIRAMYQLNVAYADEMLGRMLAALRRSGQWDKTLLVVTSDHGEEFDEQGQIAHGGNLGRQLIEVPLLVKLPTGFERRLALQPGQHPATVRLWSTLVEAAGGTPRSGMAPSLFREAGTGALSELYMGNGVNRFSWVDGGHQLVWESRFAPEEPEYYRARYQGIGGKPEPPLQEPMDAIFGRLEEAFAQTPPLSGRRGTKPQLTLWSWAGSGSEPLDDPQLASDLARQLRKAWIAANGEETLPGRSTGEKPELSEQELEELKALGYVAGN